MVNFSRRDFLKHFGEYGLGAFLAFQFGCGLSQWLRGKKRGMLLFGTRYGATKDTALWIAKGLGTKIDLFDVEHFDGNFLKQNYDYFIFGSGIWIGGIHPKFQEILTANKETIKDKVLATFIVCGTTLEDKNGKERIEGYLDQINNFLQTPPKMTRHFGGRLVVEQLTPDDKAALTSFYKKFFNKDLEGWDRTDPKLVTEFGKQIMNKVEIL